MTKIFQTVARDNTRLFIPISEFSIIAFAVPVRNESRCLPHAAVSEKKTRKFRISVMFQTLARLANAFIEKWPRTVPPLYQPPICDLTYEGKPAPSSLKQI